MLEYRHVFLLARGGYTGWNIGMCFYLLVVDTLSVPAIHCTTQVGI